MKIRIYGKNIYTGRCRRIGECEGNTPAQALQKYDGKTRSGEVLNWEYIEESAAAATLGKISTPKKAKAARANGKKGGRPRSAFDIFRTALDNTGLQYYIVIESDNSRRIQYAKPRYGKPAEKIWWKNVSARSVKKCEENITKIYSGKF